MDNVKHAQLIQNQMVVTESASPQEPVQLESSLTHKASVLMYLKKLFVAQEKERLTTNVSNVMITKDLKLEELHVVQTHATPTKFLLLPVHAQYVQLEPSQVPTKETVMKLLLVVIENLSQTTNASHALHTQELRVEVAPVVQTFVEEDRSSMSMVHVNHAQITSSYLQMEETVNLSFVLETKLSKKTENAKLAPLIGNQIPAKEHVSKMIWDS